MPDRSTKPEQHLPPTPWGKLPPRLRVLFIFGSQRTDQALVESLAGDTAVEVELIAAAGLAAGLARLREEVFDVILVSHEPQRLDAMELLDAIQAGNGDEQPVIVLGKQPEIELAALCFEAGATAYLCESQTSTRAFLWHVARARERQLLLAENRRLRNEHHHRLRQEHDEASRLLQQQRALLTDLKVLQDRTADVEGPSTCLVSSAPSESAPMDAAAVKRYRELLRAYVVMGSGNLSDEMQRLAGFFSQSRCSPTQVMRLHLKVLEEAVQGLGSRSARHILNRADLLIMEVMMKLADQFREQVIQNNCQSKAA